MSRRSSWTLATAALATLLGACPTAPLTQSVRTLTPGQTQSFIGFEWFGVDSASASSPTSRSLDSIPFLLPYYGMRIGAADRVDFGFAIHSTLTIGFDLKIQLLETDGLDIAVDPTLEYAWVWGYGYLPLLLGIHLGDSVQLVLSGRVGYQLPLAGDLSASPFDAELGGAQPVAGGGIGLYIRTGSTFAFMPEVQVVEGLGETRPTMISASIGFVFGDQAMPQEEPAHTAPLRPTYAYPAAPPPARPGPRPTYPNGGGGSAPPPGTVPPAPPGYGTGI